MAIKAISLGLALLAAVVAIPANALTLSSFGGQHDAVEVGAEVLVPTDAAKKTFVGKYEFTLSSLSNVSFFGVTTLPALGLGLFSSAGDLLAGAILSPFTGSAVTSTTLDAGSYYYATLFPVKGKMGASYAFTSQVSPVPEPSVYAMLLAGLGVVGFAARRKAKGL